MSPQKGNTMSQTPQGIKNPIKKDGAFHTPEDWDEELRLECELQDLDQ